MKPLILGAAILAALGLLVASPAAAAPLKLVATVGPGFSITLNEAGKHVGKLKAGTYSITVNDRSSIHDFHLVGPGVNMKTSVAGTGTTIWTVTLKRGATYRFMCDPHASFMHGSLKAL